MVEANISFANIPEKLSQPLLLTTKLYLPPVRTTLVPRPRLIQRLNEGVTRKLTLISAPAGFGKTTLLSEWIPQYDKKVAWFSLDAGDNDPARFWSYFITSLQQVSPEVGHDALALFQSPQPPAREVCLTILLNEVTALAEVIVLILDDYHLIDNPLLHEMVTFLLDHQPPQLHLIITTRADPPLPMSRLRGRQQLTELRSDDLRFSPDEVTSFFNQMMGLSLSSADIEALEARTEGWIAGLHLAALSMQSHEDLATFITAFTGSHRYIFDYLIDEVFARRPKSTQDFLLQTSILDRLCGSLCDAVTEESAGQLTLEEFDQSNLFIVPLDDERQWYRYHHLFAEVLRNRMQQASNLPDNNLASIAELHRRASNWFERAGLVDEAIRHAMAIPDVDRAVALVEHNSTIALQQSDVFLLRTWLEHLPAELVKTRPRLVLAHGWTLILTGHSQAVDDWLATPACSAALTTPGLASDILGEYALLQATQARFRHNFVRSIAFAQQTLTHLVEDNRGLQAGAMFTIGIAQLYQGDITAASQSFSETVVLGETKGGPYMALIALQELSELQIRQGQLSLAFETSQQAMQMATRWGWQNMPATGMAPVYCGRILYERNDLIGATQALTQGINRLRGSIERYILAEAYVTLARVQLAQGDIQSAFSTIKQGEDWFALRQVADQGASTLLALGKAWLRLEQNGLEPPSLLLAELHAWQDNDADLSHLQRVTLVRLHLVQKRFNPHEPFSSDIVEMLNQHLILSESQGWIGQVIDALVLKALVCQAQDDLITSLEFLERALILAEPEGYIRTFVDEGDAMIGLLQAAFVRAIRPDYVAKLLSACDDVHLEKSHVGVAPVDQSGIQGPTSKTQELVEPLSPRELELLQLVAAGHSNQEIAQELFLAIGTVKKHLNNIFGKLAVSSRTQASARARELDLL